MENKVERKELFYSQPTQVIFSEVLDGKISCVRLAGIAYQDKLICGCCGSILTINEDEVYIIEELSWIDITEAIGGDALEIAEVGKSTLKLN